MRRGNQKSRKMTVDVAFELRQVMSGREAGYRW